MSKVINTTMRNSASIDTFNFELVVMAVSEPHFHRDRCHCHVTNRKEKKKKQKFKTVQRKKPIK